MIEYTKIPAIFQRDTEGSKKLIEGMWCDETVEFLKDVPGFVRKKLMAQI